ncbi:division/cell wall cluster transcriptional repressor MraZ [Zavarzinia sp.]|uniref:division/cell wall cluster transcriptional repressor MraZ n=1 Tax=Zavarzinia sp. TaxID=2027920 RepID=UPI0035692250
MLALFTSTYTNKVDKKGRVSVPAPFRTLAASQGFSGIFVYPSLDYPAIDGCGAQYFDRLAAAVDELPPFSEEREAFSTAIFGASHQLAFDPEGRISLPEPLLSHAGISEAVVFVGLGQQFRIWEPAAFAAMNAKAAEITRANRARLNWPGRPTSGGAA